MSIENVFKEKSNNNMVSDHIIFVDSNGNELKCFWFSHDVILSTDNCKNFKFLKADNESLFNFLIKFGELVRCANESAGGNFVDNNKFTWHHMARSWERPFEEEAGFVATINDDCVEIEFFPSISQPLDMNKNSFFISMGGPQGDLQPYQSISNLFAITLNNALNAIPFKEIIDKEI